MMIRCLFVAAALCVGAKWAIAREPTDGEKMMIAAGIIISTAYPVPGAHVNVVNEDEAEVTSLMDQRGDKIRNIKKIEDCVYAMTVPTSGGEDGYEIIDFKRLSGEWRHSGEEMYFVGEKNAACFRNSEMGRSGCSAGVLMPLSYPLIFLGIQIQPLISILALRVSDFESEIASSSLPFREKDVVPRSRSEIRTLWSRCVRHKWPRNRAVFKMRGFLS